MLFVSFYFTYEMGGVLWLSVMTFRWVFETGHLAPGYDVFRCVVNIPEDVERVGEPAEGEQLAVMAAGQLGRLYGAATLVGKDEMNGRVNPAMEPDDDVSAAEVEKLRAGVGSGGGGGGGIGAPEAGKQRQTTL